MEKILIMDGHYDEWTEFMWEILKDEFPTEEIDEIIEETYDEARDGGAYIVIRSNAEEYDGLNYISVQGYSSDIFEKQYLVEYREGSEDELNSEYFYVYRIEELCKALTNDEIIKRLNREIDANNHSIECLSKKVEELQDIIVQMMVNREQTSDPTGIKVSEDTFVELVNKFNGNFNQNDDVFYNAEYTMSFKGLTTTMSQCPALFDMFERWEQEYL